MNGTGSCHCDCDSDRDRVKGREEGGGAGHVTTEADDANGAGVARGTDRTGPDPHVSALQRNVLIFDKLNMWSPDMPPFSWQRGEREGGTAWLPGCRGSAALACRMHRRVHTAPGPAQYPFLAVPLSLLLAPPSSSALCCSCLPHTAQRNDTKNRWKIVTKMYYGLSL